MTSRVVERTSQSAGGWRLRREILGPALTLPAVALLAQAALAGIAVPLLPAAVLLALALIAYRADVGVRADRPGLFVGLRNVLAGSRCIARLATSPW